MLGGEEDRTRLGDYWEQAEGASHGLVLQRSPQPDWALRGVYI